MNLNSRFIESFHTCMNIMNTPMNIAIISFQIDGTAFNGLTLLKELQLGQNKLKQISDGLFSPLISLERLIFYDNNLEILGANDFLGLTNLTSLFLHANKLKILHPDLFKATPNLKKLLSIYIQHLGRF